jgi:hypothetical protein
MTFSQWDIGGCNCPCFTFPCQLPLVSLTLEALVFGVSIQQTIFYPPPIANAEPCTWSTGVFQLGNRFLSFNINANFAPGITQYAAGSYDSLDQDLEAPTAAADCFVNAQGETQFSTNTMHLTGFTCFPVDLLSIEFSAITAPGGTWTVGN